MKRMIFILSMVVMMAASVSAKDYYSVQGNRVKYDGRVVNGADVRTFEDLGRGYAKDRNAVYYEGRELKYVEPNGFRLKSGYSSHGVALSPPRGNGYSNRYDNDYNNRYDRNDNKRYYVQGSSVYYGNKRVSGASASNFQVLGGGYAKDSWNVYYEGKKLKNASASSFQYLGWGYAKDAWNVYYEEDKINDASASSFRVESNGYARDNWNSYREGKKVRK